VHSLLSSPFVVAHRAGNDLALATQAVRQGSTLVEADVRLYRGRLEVRHLKTLGPVPVLWDRWRVASPFAPRLQLAELLEHAHDVPLLLDLKGRDTRLVRTLEGLLGDRPATVCSRSWGLLAHLRARPGLTIVHSVGTRRELGRLLRLRGSDRLAGVAVHERLLDADSAALLREAARLVLAWPVNTVARAQELVAIGVDGLISDRPELIAGSVRAARGAAAA
jgi:glycerophosphoryl diester phosphodiesterase